jgi:anti-sigma regulatory factor (Ser/Thr protein kinase)
MISLPIHAGADAPRIARKAALSELEGRVTEHTASDVALVISELVTNSVLHAELGADDIVLVEIALGKDRLGITVTDPGSDLVPRLLPLDPTRQGGFALRVVNDISSSWGVRRNPGAHQVWCELALGEFEPDRSEVTACELAGD